MADDKPTLTGQTPPVGVPTEPERGGLSDLEKELTGVKPAPKKKATTKKAT